MSLSCDIVGILYTTIEKKAILAKGKGHPSITTQMAQFVKDIVEDTSIIRSMGTASKLWAKEEFSLRKMIDRHKEVYSTLIESSKK